MKEQLRPFLVGALAGIVILSGPDARAARKGSEVSTQGWSAAARAQTMKKLHARLTSVPRTAYHHTVELSAEDFDILRNPGVDESGRFRIGVYRSVGRSVSAGNRDLIVRVPGAPAVRLELTQLRGTVAVFNEFGQAHNYTAEGLTHTFSGDKVRVRGSAHVRGAGAVNLGGNLCNFNASCTENAACVSIPPAIEAVRSAYASALFRSGPFFYVCTGGLIADSDPGSEIPYFLTANHCIRTKREADSLEAFFQYVQSSCTAGQCSLPATSSTTGATVVATNSTGDYTLLELGQAPPAGSVFLGWSNSPVAFSHGTALFRISHPGGAPQSYSEHSVDVLAPTCSSWPRGSRIYSRDTFGATEGGSSGSPVLNTGAEVVGQLSGACGFNVGDECDAVNNATVDGAFASYYPEVAPFLGDGAAGCSNAGDCDDGDLCTTDACTGGTCSSTPASCDDGDACTTDACDPLTGLCDNSALSCDDGNLCTSDSCDSVIGCVNDGLTCLDDGDACTTDACNPATGACESSPVVCDDGILCTSDSCDPVTGQCVFDDSTCLVCLNVGASCSTDSECCSNKCRGRRGSKNCR